MGHPTESKSQNRLELFWKDRPVKYTFEGGYYTVEEITSPWDLYVEGQYMNTPIGSVFHQVMVKNRLERIFSIRNAAGFPLCEILTKPKDARCLAVAWSARRGLKTSSPMTLDGQELIVLDVTAERGSRANDGGLTMAKEFFTKHGGELTAEHPNNLIYSTKKEIKRWRDVAEGRILQNLMISSDWLDIDPIVSPEEVVHVVNPEEAIMLLRARYWEDSYFNGDEPWIDEIVTHIERDDDDCPVSVEVYGESDQAKEVLDRMDKVIKAKQGKKK